jgi:mannose-6-phosphate isomerase
MHLLEAGLALKRAGSDRGQGLLDEVSDLFGRAFYDPETGALGEYYTDDLVPLAGEPGWVTEPGHHCEWVWLLDDLRRQGGADFSAEADRLWSHALQHGLKRGVLVDEVLRSGGAKALTTRLWPQTERLKAALVRWERGNEPSNVDEILCAFEGLWSFLSAAPEGLWRERQHADGRFRDEPAPASSLYHLTCAFSELLRVAGSN